MAGGLTISEIREALAAQLRSRMGRQTTVRAYPPSVEGPSIVITHRRGPLYSTSYGGTARVRLWVELDPGSGDLESSHRRLDDYLSAGVGNKSSVVDAITADKTLGLAGCECEIPGDEEFVIDDGRDAPLGARIPVDVHIKKLRS